MQLDPARDVISVHQMGKVGSTSVFHTLQAALPDFPVFHTHHYTAETILKVARKTMSDEGQLPPHLRDSVLFRDWVRKAAKSRERGRKIPRGPFIHLISMVRDPISRNMSAFFENIERWLARLSEQDQKRIESWLKVYKKTGETPPEDITDVLERFQKLFTDKYREDLPERWLSKELCKPFDFELMATPFDREKGYTIYEYPSCRLLFMTLESLNDVLVPALQKFLGLPKIEAARANTGTDKRYAPLYKRFTSTIDLPPEYLDRAYDNDMTRYFYNAKQIEAFRARWSKQS